MRKPASFLDDFSLSKEDEDFNYADPLCCPDDPLDEVLRYIPTLDDKILEALGIDCSSSPSVGEDEDLAVGDPKSTSAAGNSCSEASAASSSYRSVSSASASSWESESSDRASSFQYWHVPTKPRRQAVNVRKRPWSHSFLPFPSSPVPAAAVHDTHGISMANAGGVGEFSHGPQGNVCKLRKPSPGDDDGGNFSKLGYNGSAGKLGSGNGSGSGSEAGRRRSAGRQRGGHDGTRCSHCHATETPQWRAGPDGPGTLCNACGIRYRMGRDKLVPEYRPSTSPFFRNGEHSNRHSKVEKLREKKVKALKVSPGALTPTGSGGIVDSSVF